MKLTPEETAIMVEVRDLMLARYERGEHKLFPYICWTILEVVKGRDCMVLGIRLPVQMQETGGDAERLYRKITWALQGASAMRDFIGNQMWRFGSTFASYAEQFDAEARLAWLDRIIDMEEIK